MKTFIYCMQAKMLPAHWFHLGSMTYFVKAHISPMVKLQRLWNTMKGNYQICLTIGLIWAFISFYQRAPRMSGLRHASKTLYIKANRMALIPAKEKISAQKGAKQGKRPKKKRTETTIRFNDNLPIAIDEQHNIAPCCLLPSYIAKITWNFAFLHSNTHIVLRKLHLLIK